MADAYYYRRPDGGLERVVAFAQVAQAFADVRLAVQDLDDSCHSRSGLECDRDENGRCSSVDRDDVVAIVAAMAASLD